MPFGKEESNRGNRVLAAGAAAGLAAAWCLFSIFVIGVRFETNDDAGISNIAAGAFGADTQYLIHVNILAGWLIRGLSLLLPGVAWYPVFSYFLLVLGFAAVGFFLCSPGRRPAPLSLPAGAAVYLLLLLTAGTDLFCFFQYTKNAAFLTAAGLLLCLVPGEGRIHRIAGVLLSLFGSMLRFESFLPVAVIALPALYGASAAAPPKERKKLIFCCAGVLAASLLAFAVNRMAYAADPGWDHFYRYNEAREGYLDFHAGMAGEADYLDIGVREAERKAIAGWNTFDPGFFTAERFEALSAATPRALFASAAGFFADFPRLFFGNLCWPPVLFAVFLAVMREKRARNLSLLTLLIAFLGLLFVALLGRMESRVEAALLLAAAVLSLAAAGPEGVAPRPKERRGRQRFFGAETDIPAADKGGLARFADSLLRRKRGDESRKGQKGDFLKGAALPAIAAVLLLAAAPRLFAVKREIGGYLGSRAAAEQFFDRFAEDRAHLYILSAAQFDGAMGYRVFAPRKPGYFQNIVFLGGWLSESPFQYAALEGYGAENPYQALSESDLARMPASDQMHDICLFVNMHYNLYARLTDAGDGIYRLE